MIDLSSPRRIHIIGAGGAGMSGLVKLLSQMGHSLTGSDLKMSTTLAGLEDLGVEVWAGSRATVHTPRRLTSFSGRFIIKR